MKLIPLTQGKFAQVDDQDYDFLMQWKWYANQQNGSWYAIRGVWHPQEKKQKFIKMHRQILGLTDPKIKGDHEDNDSLNNQRYNLRISTTSQNGGNRRKNKNSKSKYKGVFKKYRKYEVHICHNQKRMYVGLYATEIEAAHAYDIKAKELFGEFANPNFPTAP